MSVIYEVNLAVDADIAPEFAHWLPRHIDEMLALPGFTGADAAQELVDQSDLVKWCIRYRLSDQDALKAYIQSHAEQMRADGIQRFGKKFKAHRRILTPMAIADCAHKKCGPD